MFWMNPTVTHFSQKISIDPCVPQPTYGNKTDTAEKDWFSAVSWEVGYRYGLHSSITFTIWMDLLCLLAESHSIVLEFQKLSRLSRSYNPVPSECLCFFRNKSRVVNLALSRTAYNYPFQLLCGQGILIHLKSSSQHEVVLSYILQPYMQEFQRYSTCIVISYQ